MDKVIEKMGIYELFTVLGAGVISVIIWSFALGNGYINALLYMNNESDVNLVIFLIICYIVGLILQEVSSILDDKMLKFRINARKSFLNDNNNIIKNDEELILYRKLAKKKLHKSILSEKDNELFHFRAKTYLERHSDNSKISRINSIYGMSRSLALSSLIAILFTVMSYFFNDNTFYVFGTKSICSVLMIIIELFVFALFYYRTKKYAKYKVRVIMRYYWDEMKCKK
ncbi:MAG: hypothetical protein U0K78_03185 [Agathobacter sp.]|uniref:hypothetical protein n=1 Tax=Agathobacter sp. TaxID=2021311 RepID=UPI002E79B309|nr:hypothetical protein [Agathobacter sp.]MEE1216507.1 hypothetical protein [Agathobacter sp.]